jgi:formate dehydrogenase alpha subunit
MVRMVEAAEQGHIKAMFIMGENPLRALPEPLRVRQALENLDFLVVQDILDGETARMADVVLPGAAFCEKAGSFTNLEGRIQAFVPVVPPPGHAKPDWEILDRLWVNLGKKAPYGSALNIRREIERLVPMYPEVLPDGQGWLMGAADSDTPGGRNGLIPFSPVAASEWSPAPVEYPFTASSEALRYHAGSGTRTSASPRFGKMLTEEYIELSPEDADSLGLKEGDGVTIESAFGAIERNIRLSRWISRGQVFIPAGAAGKGAPALIGLSDLGSPGASGWVSCPVSLKKR